MANSYAELKVLTLPQLKERYDGIARSTQVGLAFFREEISRREASAINQEMRQFTKQVRDMTVAILALTAVNLLVAVVLLLKA